ncbi:MAG: pseudouridine synthase [Planctomycetota bacterium]
MPLIRLQKILAAAGFGARRYCEELIADGRVSVDGIVIDEPGFKADPGVNRISVDGQPVRAETHVYYAINKPKGVVCTNNDPENRFRAIDLIKEKRRLFPVGRLEIDAEGLLLLTNDGDWCNRLTHPKNAIEKTYHVKIQGRIFPSSIEKIRTGVRLKDGQTQSARVLVKRSGAGVSTLVITVKQGMNRHISQMLVAAGIKTISIKLTAIGHLKLGKMAPGQFRRLKPDELSLLTSRRPTDEAEPPAPVDGKRPAQPKGKTPAPVDGKRPAQPKGKPPVPFDIKRPAYPKGKRPASSDGKRPAYPKGKRPSSSDGKRPAHPKGRRPAPSKHKRPR